MSLLTTDITKVKRLSFVKARLPAPEVTEEVSKPKQVERPPTDEEITYSRLVAVNPLIEDLVERLDLVSTKTGERINKVELREEDKPQEIDKPKLIALAERVIKGNKSYTKDEVIDRIKQETNVSQERAERGFNLILQAGAIEQSINPGLYYLSSSTPF